MKVRYRLIIEGEYDVPETAYYPHEFDEGDEGVLTAESEQILEDPIDFLEYWADIETADVTVVLSTEEMA